MNVPPTLDPFFSRRVFGNSLWFMGSLYTFLATAADTGGNYSLIQVDSPRGSLVPVHIHRHEDESVFVLEGDLEFELNGRKVPVSAGSHAFLPRHLPHCRRIVSRQAKLLVQFVPGGIEDYLLKFSRPAEKLSVPPWIRPDSFDLEQFFRFGCQYGIEYHPFPGQNG